MRFFTLIFFVFLSWNLSAQCITVTDQDLEGGNTYIWTSDNCYLLDGIVILESGSTLIIEPGTVVRGKAVPTNQEDVGSALIIARGATIEAVGTQDDPIIFTAEADDLNDETELTFDDRGLWGGLIVLGNAPVASETGEGAIGGTGQFGETTLFGGDDEADNSGILQYVSIRHPGAEIAPAEELNGLTLAGVGNQTIVDHIEVYACQDDAIEMKGGTVNLKHLSISFASDESIDWDLGWNGKGQFWLTVQDENSDRCGEHDGAAPDLAEPFSRPIISNVTYIGPGPDAEDSASEALLFRDRSGGIYNNSIFIHFPDHAINVEDRTDIPDSYDNVEAGNLLFNCNYWWDFGAGSTWSDLVNINPTYEDQTASFLINLMETTNNPIEDPLLVNLSADPEEFDPRLSPNSPALGTACPIDDEFFEPVTYIGAFDEENIWLQNWTGMAANEFFAFLTSTEDALEEELAFTVFPNPAKDEINVRFSNLEDLSEAEFSLFSLEGKLMKAYNQTLAENIKLNISDLPEGLFILQIKQDTKITSRKVVITQ